MNPKLRWLQIRGGGIDAVGYSIEELRLYVRFRGNAVYCYEAVKPDAVSLMLFDQSPGSTFAKAIKPNHHCAKLTETEVQDLFEVQEVGPVKSMLEAQAEKAVALVRSWDYGPEVDVSVMVSPVLLQHDLKTAIERAAKQLAYAAACQEILDEVGQ